MQTARRGREWQANQDLLRRSSELSHRRASPRLGKRPAHLICCLAQARRSVAGRGPAIRDPTHEARDAGLPRRPMPDRPARVRGAGRASQGDRPCPGPVYDVRTGGRPGAGRGAARIDGAGRAAAALLRGVQSRLAPAQPARGPAPTLHDPLPPRLRAHPGPADPSAVTLRRDRSRPARPEAVSARASTGRGPRAMRRSRRAR